MPENVRSYGLIIKNRKILVCNENINNFSATKFPGGGVEKNESPEDALIREIKEELSLECTIKLLLHSATSYPVTAFSKKYSEYTAQQR